MGVYVVAAINRAWSRPSAPILSIFLQGCFDQMTTLLILAKPRTAGWFEPERVAPARVTRIGDIRSDLREDMGHAEGVSIDVESHSCWL